MVLLPLLVASSFAKSPGWLQDGASSVDVDGARVDSPLLRGPTTDYLPAVETRVVAAGVERPTLAVIDVAGGHTRLSPEAASTLGVSWSWTKLGGDWRRIAVLDEIRFGGVRMERVRAEVLADTPGLVIGVGSLPEIAVAVLPSLGVIRVVSAASGGELVRGVGPPLAASVQPARSFDGPAGTVRGDGMTLRIPAALRWGEVVADGTFHVRTDLPTSRVGPSTRLPTPVVRAGLPFHDVGVRLGEVALPDTWVQEDPRAADPDPSYAGALGYDVLYGLDLAVAPASGLVAFATADRVLWTDATPIDVAAARERYAIAEKLAAGTADVTQGPGDGRVQIGFSGPAKGGVVLGDRGNPVVRDRNDDLAETLWQAGHLDDAMPYYLAASQAAGDDCGAHLRLGQRRLAWAGRGFTEQDIVARLVFDPIVRASTIWDVWTGLTAEVRQKVIDGQDVPEGTPQVLQPEACRVSWGLLVAAHRARGELEAVERIELEQLSRHPSVAYQRGLAALGEGRFGGADPLLGVALQMAATDPVDVNVALARAKAGQQQRDALIQLARDIPGWPNEHPLTSALGLLQAARSTSDPVAITRKVVRADERWVPGLLVHALASGEPPPPWDPAWEQRSPGSPQVICQRAVHLAVSGKISESRYLLKLQRWPGEPDWWAASAVAAHLAADPEARDDALYELSVRFPLLPVGDLGLPR